MFSGNRQYHTAPRICRERSREYQLRDYVARIGRSIQIGRSIVLRAIRAVSSASRIRVRAL